MSTRLSGFVGHRFVPIADIPLIPADVRPAFSPEVRKWGRYLIFDWIWFGQRQWPRSGLPRRRPIGAMPTKNGGALMGKPMDQVKAFAASNALHYVRQLISIVGRYGTLDKEFTALMDQLVAAYNKAKR
jgi:hypothetical protein